MASPYWLELIEDYENAFCDDLRYDVIVKAGNDLNTEEFRANSFVLCARCPYFKTAFSSQWEEKDKEGRYIFKKPNISPEVFRLILRYLYTGSIEYSEHGTDVLVQCLIAADELSLDKLINHIQEFLLSHQEILQEDPVSTLESLHQNKSFIIITECCLKIISEEPRIFFSSARFPFLEKEIIFMVFERDDLNMKEVDLWDALLRWLFIRYLKIDEVQYTLSPEGESILTTEYVKIVKQAIKEFIPLIRFYDMSAEDFFLKVYPYQALLPHNLAYDVLRCHMVPTATPRLKTKPSRNDFINSAFLHDSVFMHLGKVIDKKAVDVAQPRMPSKFMLLLRGTRDGFGAARFHQLCDNKGATLVVAKIKSSQQVVGGYNPLYWSSSENEYLQANDSFLFKLDLNNLKSIRIGYVNDDYSQYAIQQLSSGGPIFGGGPDLSSNGTTTWYSDSGSDYESVGIPNQFTIDDYEVYKVIHFAKT